MDSQSPTSGGEVVYTPFPAFANWHDGTFDPLVVDRFAELFRTAKESAGDVFSSQAVERATRYAAVDTGAIEGLYEVDRGFTRTVASKSEGWEREVVARGQHVKRAIEDAVDAYEFVELSAGRDEPMSEAWIREVHRTVCASQPTFTVYTSQGPQEHELPLGKYKASPNSPTKLGGASAHAYASVLDTQPEMQRLIGELRSAAFLSAHPVLQAAYAHYAYVCIHPFSDGNGRVARALASRYLYTYPGVPLIVFADQRNEYYDALEAADAGDPSRFIVFMEARTVDAIDITRVTLTSFGSPIEDSLAAINSRYASGGLSDEVFAKGAQVRGLLVAELKKQINALDLPRQVARSVVSGGSQTSPNPGFVSLGTDTPFFVWIRTEWPRKANVTWYYGVFVRGDPSALSDFQAVSPSGDTLEIWVRELDPVVSETVVLKIRGWAEGQVRAVIAEFSRSLSSSSK